MLFTFTLTFFSKKFLADDVWTTMVNQQTLFDKSALRGPVLVDFWGLMLLHK